MDKTTLEELFKQYLSPIDNRLSAIEGKQFEVINKLSKIETNIGELYESTIQKEVIKRYGEKYAQSFLDESLFGLARVSFPKKAFVTLPPQYKELDETQILQKHVLALRNHIFSRRLYEYAENNLFQFVKGTIETSNDTEKIKKIEEEIQKIPLLGKSKDDIEEKENNTKRSQFLDAVASTLESTMKSQQKKKKKLRTSIEGFKKLSQFYKQEKQNRPHFLESNSRLGILCLTSTITSPPALSLEYDCRGRVEISSKTALIDIGEIKKDITTCRKKAVDQLILRLKTMEEALKIISKECGFDIKDITKIGRIFHATKHHFDTRSEINSIVIIEEFTL